MMNSSDAVLDSLIEKVRRIVLEEIGADRIGAIFVTGSVARGEVAAWSDGKRLEIYSDLDVAVVLTRTSDLDADREIVRRRVEDIDLDSGRWRVFSPPDVGVFTVEDLARQRARPGTVDIARYHRTVFGDAAVAAAPRWSIGDIPEDESLYLLEHRMLEACAARDMRRHDKDGGVARFAYYVALKSALDVASAVLVASGRYSSSREERVREFLSPEFQARAGDMLPPGAEDVVSSCHGALSSLRDTMRAAGEEGAELSRRVNELMVETWQRIARRLRGTPDAGWTELVTWRGSMDRRRRLGTLITLARRRSVSPLRILWQAGSSDLLSPVDILRLSGLMELEVDGASHGPMDEEALRTVCRALDRLTSAFGFTQGTVFDRARAMYGAVT